MTSKATAEAPSTTADDTATTEPPEAPEATTDPAETPAETTDDNPSHEAAKYRRQLREAESTRDGLAARITTMQTTEVERLAEGPGKLLDASDLWRVTDLANLLDTAGDLDPEKIKAAVDQLLIDKPHYGNPEFNTDRLDLGGIGNGFAGKPADTAWSQVLNPSAIPFPGQRRR